ncbi:hypothetical protein V6N13_010942 [Hibiscus sabdariffa]
MLSTSTVESESFVKLKENRITCETDEKSSASEAASIGHHRDKTNHVGFFARKTAVGYGGVCCGTVAKQLESTNDSKKEKTNLSVLLRFQIQMLQLILLSYNLLIIRM